MNNSAIVNRAKFDQLSHDREILALLVSHSFFSRSLKLAPFLIVHPFCPKETSGSRIGSMRLYFRRLFALCCFLPSLGQAQPLSDAAIKRALIDSSRAEYKRRLHKTCPCPNDVDRAGHQCGKRSAYIRQGGETPLCEDKNITPAMIQQWKADHPGQ